MVAPGGSDIPNSWFLIPDCFGSWALGSFEVFACAGVYFYSVAFVDEDGNVDSEAGFEGGGLGRACGGVALYAGVAIGDGQDYGGGEVNVYEGIAVHEDVYVVVFAHV